MRIISWNCYRGECRKRASQLASLAPDLVVLQECGRPEQIDNQCIWFGNRPAQGVGVVARNGWTLKHVNSDPFVGGSVYPVEVVGPVNFNLLAVWSKPQPTYVQAILAGLDENRNFLTSAPAVVVGDFNSHPRWDANNRAANHSTLTARLRQEFGLVSAFHAFPPNSLDMSEPPTLYWQWKKEQPFHIDYCFIPQTWVNDLQTVEICGYDDWAGESDHRPLIVEVFKARD